MHLYNGSYFNITGIGWRAKLSPKDHPVCEYEFDVLAGADGSRNAVTGK